MMRTKILYLGFLLFWINLNITGIYLDSYQDKLEKIEIIETESTYFKNTKLSVSRGNDPRGEKILKIMTLKKVNLTIQDIKQQFKDERIVRITIIDKCYALVESHKPTIAPRFWFFDLETGEKQRINTEIYYTQILEIWAPQRLIFRADGTNHLNGDRSFPFLMELEQYQPGEDFQSRIIPLYLPLEESVNFGQAGSAELIDFTLTMNGLEVCFGPQKDTEGGKFFKAFPSVPRTTTKYDKENHQFTIIFKGTKIKEGMEQSINADKMYIHTLELVETESDTLININLKERAKYYRGIDKYADPSQYIPLARFIFISQYDYESWKSQNQLK